MAAWILYKNRHNFLTLLYRNLLTGVVLNCGDLRLDTPGNMVVDWILRQEAVQPGDIIRLPDGGVLQLAASNQARA